MSKHWLFLENKIIFYFFRLLSHYLIFPPTSFTIDIFGSAVQDICVLPF